jgi:hypothetical protein
MLLLSRAIAVKWRAATDEMPLAPRGATSCQSRQIITRELQALPFARVMRGHAGPSVFRSMAVGLINALRCPCFRFQDREPQAKRKPGNAVPGYPFKIWARSFEARLKAVTQLHLLCLREMWLSSAIPSTGNLTGKR